MAGLNGEKSAEAIVLGAWESHVQGEGLNVASVYRFLSSQERHSNPPNVEQSSFLEGEVRTGSPETLSERGGRGWHGNVQYTLLDESPYTRSVRTAGVGGRGHQAPPTRSCTLAHARGFWWWVGSVVDRAANGILF